MRPTGSEERVMSDEFSSQTLSGVQIDSLTANEFAVELEGERISGVFRVTGLTPFKLDVKPSLTKIVRDPFKISKMVQRDPNSIFNRWLQETTRSREDIVRPTRRLAVVALDEGIETRRWEIIGAYITEVAYSEFNSGSRDLVEEVLTIMYERVEEVWPDPGV
jgi:hypothetical protein